jgi:hypothetical protein
LAILSHVFNTALYIGFLLMLSNDSAIEAKFGTSFEAASILDPEIGLFISGL